MISSPSDIRPGRRCSAIGHLLGVTKVQWMKVGRAPVTVSQSLEEIVSALVIDDRGVGAGPVGDAVVDLLEIVPVIDVQRVDVGALLGIGTALAREKAERKGSTRIMEIDLTLSASHEEVRGQSALSRIGAQRHTLRNDPRMQQTAVVEDQAIGTASTKAICS